jgi:hypothetical protein
LPPGVETWDTDTEPPAPPIDARPLRAAFTWSAVALKGKSGVVALTPVIGFVKVRANVPLRPLTWNVCLVETPSKRGVQVLPLFVVLQAPPPEVEM